MEEAVGLDDHSLTDIGLLEREALDARQRSSVGGVVEQKAEATVRAAKSPPKWCEGSLEAEGHGAELGFGDLNDSGDGIVVRVLNLRPAPEVALKEVAEAEGVQRQRNATDTMADRRTVRPVETEGDRNRRSLWTVDIEQASVFPKLFECGRHGARPDLQRVSERARLIRRLWLPDADVDVSVRHWTSRLVHQERETEAVPARLDIGQVNEGAPLRCKLGDHCLSAVEIEGATRHRVRGRHHQQWLIAREPLAVSLTVPVRRHDA
ncbi:MAG: hypothetical protein ACLGHT_11480, partial [Acidimicrobiia bacterium]